MCRAARFLRVRLALRRTCLFLLGSSVAAIVACPVLWLLSVRGVAGLTGLALFVAAAIGAASAFVWPSRRTVETAAAAFLDRELSLGDKVLSVFDADTAAEHAGTAPSSICRFLFEPLLLRETEAALCQPVVDAACRLSSPRLLRYCAAAVMGWACVAILGQTLVFRPTLTANESESRGQTQTRPGADDILTAASDRSPGRVRGGSAGENSTHKTSEAAADPVGDASAPVAGGAAAREETKNGDLRVAAKLAAVMGFAGTLENSKDADSFVAFAEKTLAEASDEEKRTLFKSVIAALDGDENTDSGVAAAALNAAARAGDSEAFRDYLAGFLQHVLSQAGKAGGSGTGAGDGVTVSRGTAGDTASGRVEPSSETGSPAESTLKISGRPFVQAAVRERTERALREGSWPLRADAVVRRFFTE